MPNTNIRLAEVVFKHPLPSGLLPAFRGAISKAAGQHHILFHNHTEQGFRYAYPMIQYKLNRQRPSLVCLNDGIEEVVHFFTRQPSSMELNGIVYYPEVEEVRMREYHCRTLEEPKRYFLRNWLALNSENFRAFNRLKGPIARKELLSNILAGNIKSMGKTLGWWIDTPIEIEIDIPYQQATTHFKGNQMPVFTVRFSCNLELPEKAGLGKGVSLGYGTLLHERKKNQYANS